MEPEQPPRAIRDPEVLDDGAPPERRIGSYRLLRELGRGGFGSVFLAARADEEYQKLVAIKVMRGADADEREVVRRFRRERQILAALEHPNIARLLDGGTTEDGLPYLVMEYVEGVSVNEYCDGRGLPVSERLRIFQTICAAVAFAHRNLIVHRDLKPSNILVTADGVPKLLDFGIAKLVSPAISGAATATGFAMTPEYASPEQVRGELVTTASDVYALGVVLYELLTGRRPYRLRTHQPFEVLRAICEDEPEKPSTAVGRRQEASYGDPAATVVLDKLQGAHDAARAKLRRRLAGDLDNIVLMALRKEPQRRYRSVEALSDDVGRHLDGRPVLARKGTASYRAWKFVHRHTLGVAAAALLLLLLVGFAVAMTIQSARLARERDRAAQERDKAEKVSGLLVDLFKVFDPGEAKNSSVTPREILDRGTERVRGELKDNPEVQATLLDTLGRVYMSLGSYDQSEGLLRAALETRKRVLGAQNVDVAATMNALAAVLYYKGDYAGAETLWRQTLTLRRALLGNEHPDVAATMSNLAAIRYQRGDYSGAEELWRETLTLRRRALGDEHPEVADTMNNLADVLEAKGDHARAEALHRQTLTMKRKLLGDDHPEVATTMKNLAGVLANNGDYPGAESLYRQALAIQRKALPQGHPDIAESESALAACLIRLKQYGEAESLLLDAYPILRAKRSDRYPLTQKARRNLVELYEAWGKPQQAALYREAPAAVGATH
jgi:serine/threonine-protein kinase